MKKKIITILATLLVFAVSFTCIPAVSSSLDASAASYIKKLSASADTTGSVSLSWTKLSKKQQKKVSGIAIFRNGAVIKNVKKSASSYTDTGLEPGTAYVYQVKTYKKITKKTKMWLNKQTGEYQKKKPAKKYRGRSKTFKTVTYKYANASPEVRAVTKSASAPVSSESGTPFANHGRLSVKGTDLVDKNGTRYCLRGMSTHGIAWFPEYVCEETLKYLRDDWGTNCIRLAMYTYESGGYCTDGKKSALMAKVSEGVDIATKLGMYVIVDWHVLNEQSPLVYKDEARAFFKEISAKYGGQGNVLYEICNEPNGSADWNDVKSYANEIIPVIRSNDPDGIVLAGTPTWSQDIDKAAASPLSYDNVMYSLHFYAATHTDWLRNRTETAVKNGLPVFISEFGICDASGNGKADITQANKWKELIDKYDLSAMCWNLSNKNEASAVISTGCKKLSGWKDSELKDEGRWARDWFRSGY